MKLTATTATSNSDTLTHTDFFVEILWTGVAARKKQTKNNEHVRHKRHFTTHQKSLSGREKVQENRPVCNQERVESCAHPCAFAASIHETKTPTNVKVAEEKPVLTFAEKKKKCGNPVSLSAFYCTLPSTGSDFQDGRAEERKRTPERRRH